MFNQSLLLLYRISLNGRERRISWLDNHLGYDGREPLSPDEMKNEASAYETIFSEDNRPNLEGLYLELLNEMNGVPYGECADLLDALTFIQEISATALWRYRRSVGTMIENFVRDFDRLDVSDELFRIYEKAQNN